MTETAAAAAAGAKSEFLVKITGLRVEGRSQDTWSEIVGGVDLHLRRGEVLGLIGETGAGKSTIGLAAMGYARNGCRISDGEVLFDGIDLRKAPESEHRKLFGARIAYVPQSAAAAFNPAHKLINQCIEAPVRHGMLTRAQAESEARHLFGRLRLPDADNIGYRYPHQVSGGQMQRVMTAMASACGPDLIVFDEPTTALDVTTQIEIMTAIRDIVGRTKTAAIYITHDLAVVAQMADRIMVLRHGKLVEEGETRKMLANPQEAYTRSLLAVRTFRKPVPTDTPPKVPLLEMKGVTAAYPGGVTVLKKVNLVIPHKRTVAVVGESGGGKSTMARVITGLLPPTKGEVLFNGKPLPRDYRRRSKDLLRRWQMIYQMPDTALNPKTRVSEVIGRPLSFYLGMKGKQKEERIKDLLRMIEMEPGEYIDRLPAELSGGEKQRICIARALAAEPDLIICDEITSALDQLVAEEILKLMQRLQDECDLSYMLITHDLATVRAVADEVVVVLRGRVLEQREKNDIFTPPHHGYTDLLLSSIPEMDPDWLTNLQNSRAKAGRAGKHRS